jgi:tetratricopeptide (TPR) repeat protein
VYRDFAQEDGTIALLANRRQGTLEVFVREPGPVPSSSGKTSPWQGMSGAAVWVDDYIVGIVALHQAGDGPRRLTAVRVDKCYDMLSAATLEQLVTQLPLPGTIAGLPLVPIQDAIEVPDALYLSRARELVPDQLIGRETELADLSSFLSSGDKYLWWQGEPWAGKTALAAWVASRPTEEVEVVSHFIIERLQSEANSDGFNRSMVGQLASIAGERASTVLASPDLEYERRRLMVAAADAAASRGRRILLIVDGLDEDVDAGRLGKTSVASILPKSCPPNMQVLVTSRRSPGIPSDVADDHPLRYCRIAILAPSPHAKDLQRRATGELRARLHGSILEVDVVGLLVAADDGLTLQDISAFTKEARWVVEELLETSYARSLTKGLSRVVAEGNREVQYTFAHATLIEVARHMLQEKVGEYRARIHQEYLRHRANEPSLTDLPPYFFEPYGRVLVARQDWLLLADIASDPERQTRLSRRTGGGDGIVLSEVMLASSGLRKLPSEPPLGPLAHMAAARTRIGDKNIYTPAALPAVWARLGQLRRAYTVATGLGSDDNSDVAALEAIVDSMSGVGAWPEVLQVADWAVPEDKHDEHLLAIIERIVSEGRLQEAADAVTMLRDPEQRDAAISIVGDAALTKESPSIARALLAQLSGQQAKFSMLSELCVYAIQKHDWAVLSSTLSDAAEPTSGWVMVASVEALVAEGEVSRADELVERIIEHELGPRKAMILGLLLRVLATGRRVEKALRVAQLLIEADPRSKPVAFACLSIACAGGKEKRRLRGEAERAAHTISNPMERAIVLAAVANILAGGGQRVRALVAEASQLLSGFGPISDPMQLALSYGAVIEALIASKQLAGAASVTAGISNEQVRDGLALAIVMQARTRKEFHVADRIIGTMASTGANIVQALRHVQLGRHAAGLIEEATRMIEVAPAWWRTLLVRWHVQLLCRNGQVEAAEEFVRNCEGDMALGRGVNIQSLVTDLIQVGELEKAKAWTKEIRVKWEQTESLAAIANAHAAVEDSRGVALKMLEQAEGIARTGPGDEVRTAEALSWVALGLARLEEPRALDLASEIDESVVGAHLGLHSVPALLYLMKSLGLSGKFDIAASTLDQLDPILQVRSSAYLATGGRQHDPVKALAICHEALNSALRLNDDEYESYVLSPLFRLLAEALAFCGDTDGAMRAAFRAPLLWERQQAFIVVAERCWSINRSAGEVALGAAADVDVAADGNARSSSAAVALGKAAARLGNIAECEEYLANASRRDREELLAGLALALARSDKQRALQTIAEYERSVDNSHRLLSGADEIIETAVLVGESDLARELVDKLSGDGLYQADRLYAFGAALVKIGKIEQAETVLNELESVERHSYIEAAKSSLLKAAIVDALLANGDAHRSRSSRAKVWVFLADLLTGQDWYLALPALSLLDPGSLDRVAVLLV